MTEDSQVGFIDELVNRMVVDDDEVTSSVPKAVKEHAGKESFDATFDTSLAQEMNALSLQERERKYEELHGVAEVVAETPEFLVESLQQLEQELLNIPNKQAYVRAWCINRKYVESRNFRVMFLRADLFDAKKAAARLVRFIEKKVEIFGPDTLARSLRLSDLNEDDLRTLKGGAVQILPSRDRSGRLIFFQNILGATVQYTSFTSLFKCWWYLLICAFEEDEETQRRGAIMIAWVINEVRLHQDADASVARDMREANYWMPMRLLNGIHLCIDPSPAKQILSRVLIAVVDKQLRPNFKVHSGRQTLMSYGIPTEEFPVTLKGIVSTKNQVRWIARRQVRDNFLDLYSSSSFDKVELPSSTDVLLIGRRMLYHRHAGNQNFRLLVESLLQRYWNPEMTKESRYGLSKSVVAQIQTEGRFLRKDKDDWWIEVPDQEAREKVARAFTTLQKTAIQIAEAAPVPSSSSEPIKIGLSTDEPSSKKLRRQLDGLLLSDNDSVGDGLDCFGARISHNPAVWGQT